jgi:hypothetical protein
MRIAFSLLSVPELQKNALLSEAGASDTSFSAARARVPE